jgi:hypothetical protein
VTETISAAADRLNISREQLRLWLLAANVYVPRSEGARSPMVLDSSVIERVVAERPRSQSPGRQNQWRTVASGHEARASQGRSDARFRQDDDYLRQGRQRLD